MADQMPDQQAGEGSKLKALPATALQGAGTCKPANSQPSMQQGGLPCRCGAHAAGRWVWLTDQGTARRAERAVHRLLALCQPCWSAQGRCRTAPTSCAWYLGWGHYKQQGKPIKHRLVTHRGATARPEACIVTMVADVHIISVSADDKLPERQQSSCTHYHAQGAPCVLQASLQVFSRATPEICV